MKTYSKFFPVHPSNIVFFCWKDEPRAPIEVVLVCLPEGSHIKMMGILQYRRQVCNSVLQHGTIRPLWSVKLATAGSRDCVLRLSVGVDLILYTSDRGLKFSVVGLFESRQLSSVTEPRDIQKSHPPPLLDSLLGLIKPL